MIRRIGFSGSRNGYDEMVGRALAAALLAEYEPGAEFHHGCCKNSDVMAAAIAKAIGYRIIAHPPVKTESLAPRYLWLADEIRDPKSYFARNREIVIETDKLIATPPGPDIGSGGTWYTINYAKASLRPTIILMPR